MQMILKSSVHKKSIRLAHSLGGCRFPVNNLVASTDRHCPLYSLFWESRSAGIDFAYLSLKFPSQNLG